MPGQDESFHIRPRFKTEISGSVKNIEAFIKETLDAPDSRCIGTIAYGFATINIPAQDQHFWSPQLTISYEEEEEITILRGLYAPKPSVWTMFVFFYAIVGLATLAIAMVGLSHLTMEKDASILWLIPVMGLLFLSLFWVARIGQKLGKKQMEVLQNFVHELLQKLPHKAID